MKIKSVVTTIVLGLLITACNSTPKKITFVKKVAVSDHYLLMSLINRPITTDQQMMLAFAKQRETHYSNMFVNAVSIKGPKFIDNSEPQNIYSALIDNDNNAVSIQGPTPLKSNEI